MFRVSHPFQQCVLFSSFSLTAAFISSVLAGHSPDVCVKAGLMAAWYSVQGPLAVSASVIPEQFTIDRIEFWAPWQATILDTE